MLKELKELYNEMIDRDRVDADNLTNAVLTLGKIIYRIEKKRKPLPDGTLPLTEEEFKELQKIIPFYNFYCKNIVAKNNLIICKMQLSENEDFTIEIAIDNYKVILWLAERFNLTGKEDKCR